MKRISNILFAVMLLAVVARAQVSGSNDRYTGSYYGVGGPKGSPFRFYLYINRSPGEGSDSSLYMAAYGSGVNPADAGQSIHLMGYAYANARQLEGVFSSSDGNGNLGKFTYGNYSGTNYGPYINLTLSGENITNRVTLVRAVGYAPYFLDGWSLNLEGVGSSCYVVFDKGQALFTYYQTSDTLPVYVTGGGKYSYALTGANTARVTVPGLGTLQVTFTSDETAAAVVKGQPMVGVYQFTHF